MIRAVNLDDPEYEVVTVAGSKETEGFRDGIGKGVNMQMHLFFVQYWTDDQHKYSHSCLECLLQCNSAFCSTILVQPSPLLCSLLKQGFDSLVQTHMLKLYACESCLCRFSC